MLRIMNQTDIKSFDYVKSEYPYSRLLMQVNTLDDYEGRLMAVSDFSESDDDLCEKLHELLDDNILCVIVGSYVQGGNSNVIYSVK